MSVEAIQLFEQKKSGLAKARTHAEKALAIAKSMVIETPEDYALAGERIVMAKSREELIDGVREEIVVPIGRAHRYMSGEFKKSTDAWKKVWVELNSKRVAYDRAQKAQAAEREREVRQLQLEAAEVEAEEARKRGDDRLAEELKAEANKPFVPIPLVPVAAPKTEGLQERKTFKARIEDLEKVPMAYCKKVPDLGVLNGLARTACKRFEGDVEKANAQAPEGVVFYEDTTPAKVG